MCELCEKADFLIDSLERLCSLEEARDTLRKCQFANQDKSGLTNGEIEELLKNDKLIILSLITRMAVRWGIRARIHPGDFFWGIEQTADQEYGKHTAKELIQRLLGQQDPEALRKIEELKKKLEEYQS